MIGAKLNSTTTTAEAAPLDHYYGPDGKCWIYVQANGAIAQYDVVAIDETGQAAPITKALADDAHKIAVAQIAFADNEYGYVQTKGACSLNVLANCAEDAILYTSATAGSLDDTATSQTKITGLVTTETDGGSGGNVTGNMPVEPFANR